MTCQFGSVRSIARVTALAVQLVCELHLVRIWGLSEYPRRGSYPRELVDIGIREYRDIFVNPYRMVYRVAGSDVFVLLIVDGRRDTRGLPERRLLR